MSVSPAEKARQFVGEDESSQSGKFTWINCFDMGYGSMACLAKEGTKSFVYNIRGGHIARVRQRSYEIAYANALAQGRTLQDASKEANIAGRKAEKLASRHTQRILGPLSSAAWDTFEGLYYGGTLVEAITRGIGTIGGAYWGGFQGEENLGRIGYFVGSHVGSWIGGRVGLMVYDISNAAHFLINGYLNEENYVDGDIGYTAEEVINNEF